MDEAKRKEKRAEQEKRLKETLSKIKNKLVIISGKGGVGKTTVAVNIAYSLAFKEKKVGILDVDIHGPNIPKMLGIEGKRLMMSEAGIEPAVVLPDIKVVSLALLLENQNQPVIWRGPLKMITIRQLLADVNWGDLDYLIIDSPPGTGDEPLSVCQLIPDMNGAIVVTTPQDVATMDARKSVVFAQKLNVPVTGIIENMSGFVCPHCKKEINLFGSGGGEKSAYELDVPYLGKVPLEAEMVKSGDSGRPFVYFKKGSPTAEKIMAIVDKIVKQLNGDDE